MTRLKLLISSFLLIHISSCAFISYNEIPSLFSNAIFGAEKIFIKKDFYNKADFSFINIRLNNKSSAVLTLFNVDNKYLKWISSDGEILITSNGKIHQTIGLPNDYEIINNEFMLKDNLTFNHYIKLSNPDGFFAAQNNILFAGKSEINYLEEMVNVDVYKETSYIQMLNRKVVNTYYVNENRVLKSIQDVQPGLGKIDIEYYYK